MARLQIFKSDLINALEDHSDETRWLLDLQTGEVVLVPGASSMLDEEEFVEIEEQIEAEPERFRHIEPLPSRVGFDIMAEFAEDLPDSRLTRSSLPKQPIDRCSPCDIMLSLIL